MGLRDDAPSCRLGRYRVIAGSIGPRVAMSDGVQLLIHEFIDLSPRSITCTVRCVSGSVRVGQFIRLIQEAAGVALGGRLTLAGIQLYVDVPLQELTEGLTAIVTADGPIDDRAVRTGVSTAEPGKLFSRGFLLTNDTAP